MNRKLIGTLAKVVAAAGWADKRLNSNEIENLKDLLFQLQSSVIDPREDARFKMYLKSPVDVAEREDCWQNYASPYGLSKRNPTYKPP